MATVRIPQRRCERCREWTPMEDLVRMEIMSPTRDCLVWTSVCRICAHQLHIAFIVGWDLEDLEIWFHPF